MSTLRLSEFADSFPPEMKEKIDHLSADLLSAAAEKLEASIQEPSHTGALRSSRTKSRSGKGLRLGWTDPGAVGVDIGRIKSRPYSRVTKSGGRSVTFTRLLGSDQAPQGFSQPAIKALRFGWDSTVEEAGKKEGF